MSILREKQLDQRLVLWFKQMYPKGVCIKLAMVGAHGTSGWPDRLFLANGKAAFVELKAFGKFPTPLQEQRMHQLMIAGCEVMWFDNMEGAARWIAAVLGDGNKP